MALRDPSRMSGIGSLGPSMADLEVGVEQIARAPMPDYGAMRRPQESSGPSVYFDQGRNLFSVNGYTFDAEDYGAAVGSRQYLGGAPTPPPDQGSWTRLTPDMYEQYMRTIEEPTLGTRFSRSFDIGVQNLKTLGGAGLQFLGAEETGAGVVNRASAELQRLSPFQASAADVAAGELGAIEYAVSMIGQQGPNILESIGTALVGAVAGGAMSANPVGAAVGGFGAMLSKGAIKTAAKEAAEAYARGAASAEQRKLLARIGGAAAATAVNNYAIGVSDVYSEMRDQGAAPQDMDARAIAATLGIPYAVLSTIPEAVAAGRVFGLTGASGGLLRRFATGVGAGAVLEGATETGQEALVMAGGATQGADYDDEYLARLIEAGVAGAVVGGGIGGIANLASNKPADVLQGQQTPPPAPTTTPGLPGPAPVAGLLPPPAAQLPAPPVGALPAPPAQLPAPDRSAAAAPDVIVPAAPAAPVAPAPVAPAPAPAARPLTRDTDLIQEPVAPAPPVAPTPAAPPTATELGLEGPVAEGFAMGAARQGPPAPPRTAAAPPAAAPNQLQRQLMELMQRRQAAVQAQPEPVVEAPVEAPVEPTPAPTGEITPREYDTAFGDWELIRAQQPNPDSQPTLVRINKKAQREWAMAVRAGEADADLFRRLAKRKVRKADPLVATGVTATREADINAMRQQVEAARAAEAAQRDLQGQAAALRALGQRMERVRPPLPANTYGTAEGQPFKSKAQANAPANRKRVAEQITDETDQRVTPKDLEATQVPGGWALRVKAAPTPPPTPTPTPPAPKPKAEALKRGKKDAVQKPSPAPRPLRKGPEAGGKVRGRDTEGQGPTGEGQTQAEGETEVETDAQEQPPVRETEVAPAPVEPTIARGDSAPADMGAVEAWDKYVKPFLMVPVDRTIISKAEAAQAWSTAIKAGRGNVDTALNLLRESISYTALEAQMILQQDPGVRAVDEDARDMAMYSLLETAFVSDPTGSKPAALGKKTAVQFSQDVLTEHNWTQVDREILLDFATQKDIADARKAEKPTRQMQALNALLESTGILSTADNVDGSNVTNPASNLAEEIVAYNEDPHTPVGWEQDRLRALVRDFNTYARENPDAYGSLVEGNTPLYQYLDNKGSVRISRGRITPDPTATDPRTQARVAEGGSTEVGGALTGGFAPRTGTVKGGVKGRYSRIDFNTLTDALDTNGSPLAGAMPVGKQKLTIRNFVGRLQNAPRVYDFKNQADLQRRNPGLYARAAAARVDGDFDQVAAAGYSFGDGEVIIFTDRIANEKHLKFVLAHETLGHYGLRGVLPAAEFDSLMQGIYDGSPAIQRAVDAAMERNDSIGRAEAVEEYLSDYAAELEVNVVRRVWNAIKNVLNRLGVTFSDDSVRYVLDQARRYARGPRQGFAADLNQIGQRLGAVEMGTLAPGRFKTASDMFKDMRSFDELARMGLPLPRDFQQGLDAMKGQWGNFSDKWAGFKSTFLSLHGFDARTNPGLNRLHNVLQEATSIAMAQRNTLNETMRPALNRAILGRGGMTNAEYDLANNLLHHARIRAVMRTRSNPVDSDKPLVIFNESTGKFERTAEVDRLDKLNRLTLEDARRGFSYDFVNTDADGNVVSTERITVPPNPNLTEGSRVWLAYEAARKAYIDTELRLLIAQLSAGTVREATAFKEIGSVVPDGRLTTEERALLRRAIRRYQELYAEGSSVNSEGAIVYVDDSMKTARAFAEAFNKAMIANEEAATDTEATKRNDAVKKFFDQAIQDDVVAEIEAFKARAVFGADRFIIQNKIISLHTQSMQENGASDFARNSIINQYSPIVREGDWETRLRAVDIKTGKVVSLDAGFKDGLLYAQFDSRAEAKNFQKQVTSAFGTDTYTVKARNNAGEMVDTEVRFEPVVGRVLLEAANPLGVNLNEFIAGLNYFNINLRPEKREEIIQAMTRQDAAARTRLRAGLNPGDARDAISGIAKHIDSRASTIAKVQTRPLIDELMNRRIRSSNELWNGDGLNLDRLRKRLAAVTADPNASKETRTVAQREYEDALMMYNATNPAEGESRANDALNKAARTLDFLDSNASVNESDFEGSGLISAWRSYTSLIQLGGSIATGLLNPVSVYTNGVPYLASYNEKTAFGGGFGAGRAMAAVNTAFAQVGLPGIKGEGIMDGMNTADFWDKVQASDDLQKRFNVTMREAQMIAREIREGRMIPAQSNALVNSSRGRTTRGGLSKAIDLWMSPFNLTEQASRRAFGLASFRLEYARQMGGIDPTMDRNSPEYTVAEQAAYDRAVEFAGKAMDTALGDYSVLNRPAFFRTGLASMLYMYKVFPTTSIQTFMNLSRNGKMGMLAGLWLLGGVAAFPFAEDLEDLLDTLMQKAGIGEGSVRAWAAQRLDEMSPGLSPLVLKGVMGNVFVGDIASRVSLSVIPGSDILLAGANTTRAFEEILGPMPSALLGSLQFAADLVKTPFSTTQTLEATLREAPVSGLRMAADTYAYAQSGAIIDRRGYIVAPDVTVGELVTRLAGFYPRRAAEQYGNIRVMKRVADYRREATTAYRQEWVAARVRNDRTRMQEIEQSVREWNNYHRGGPLVIEDFVSRSQRAYKEAMRPASQRTLRTLPEASRDQLEKIADALTY